MTVDLDRHVYGPVDAPLTVIEYGDFECPYCGAAAPVLRKLIDGADGAARMIFRHFPVFSKHPFALTAALAAEASGERFWAMHDLLFTNQDRLTDADLAVYAETAGVEGAVTGDAVQVHREAVEADYDQAVIDGVRGTPTIFVNGRLYQGRLELGTLRAALGLRH
ncbi:DsbA family protein [Phytohabitans kaempferiae]|uniref:DsbA family protein n=1 Tax=Phytohabitans kaempferiae TaxID=1620943 RepID=A0ABV6M269_9ACTN